MKNGEVLTRNFHQWESFDSQFSPERKFWLTIFTGEKVLTYNFATALTETTIINLSTLTTIFQLVSSFQNCELKQESCALATALQMVYCLFWLTIFTCLHGKNNPQFIYTYNYISTGLLISKLWVKTRTAYLQPRYKWFTACFDLQFSPALPIITTSLASTLPTALQMVYQSKNCGLKQEPCTLATELSPPLNANGNEGI